MGLYAFVYNTGLLYWNCDINPIDFTAEDRLNIGLRRSYPRCVFV
jgi:hypothetical protein